MKYTLDVKSAIDELGQKDDRTLETETAYKWASRACAAYTLAAAALKTQPAVARKWFRRGEDLKHEALEHAALAEDSGATLIFLEGAMKKYRNRLPIGL